jgi:hypothetical protein
MVCLFENGDRAIEMLRKLEGVGINSIISGPDTVIF